MSTKTTAQVNAALAKTAAKKSAGPATGATSPSTTAPSRGQAGWIDPIRASGDTRFTDKFGTPTQAEIADASSAGAPNAATAPTDATVPPPTSPVSTTAATTAPTAPATTGTSGIATAPVSTSSAAPTPTQNKYATGMAAAQASGVPAPQDPGQARSMASSYMPPEQQDTTAVDQFVSQDPGINTLMQGITQLLSPQNQTTSLMQDYTKLRKNSGLDKINQEIIDADTVINGTEDDIRNEIQTAGGLGTESQVQAMTLARNKSLLTRYNQLVQMKTDATNNLNTMMSLNQQDKQMAQEKINSQVSAMFNMANFRQTALNNTRQQYQWMSEQMGADGLYNSLAKDPRQLGFAEKILGLSPGGMQSIAVQASQDRARKTQMDNLDIASKQASIANTYSEISARNAAATGNSTLNGKPQNDTQLKVNGYADRLTQANQTLSALGSKFTGKLQLGSHLPSFLQSKDRQAYEQAKTNFVTATLRQESGASIAPSEFKDAAAIYFPTSGDTANTVAQKDALRNTVINNFYREANVPRPLMPGDSVVKDGKSYVVAADGYNLNPK